MTIKPCWVRCDRAVVLSLCLIAATVAASIDAEAPARDCTRLRLLSETLSQSTTLEPVRAAIVEQLRLQAPIAYFEGFWVSPVDLAPALTAANAVSGPNRAAPDGGASPLLGLAFTDSSLRDGLPLPFVGDFPDLPPSPETVPHIIVLPLDQGSDAVLEYLAPESECRYFCLDPAEWDFDRDGVPNASDPDDDGDGVADSADAYPYWPRASEGPREGTLYVGFTGKSSERVADAVLILGDRLRNLRGEGRAVLLGPIAEQGALFLLLLDCPSEPAGCPDPDDPLVRYMSRDPQACAVIRFRCEPGQVPFSNECGCGCQAVGSPEAE